MFGAVYLHAQSFEVIGQQESYRGYLGDLIKAPLKIKNNTEKHLTLILRKVDTPIGSSQKSYFCPDNSCLERADDMVIRLEPGQTLSSFSVGLEAGLVEGSTDLKYMIYNKSNPAENLQIEFNFVVEPKPEKNTIYTSNSITIHDVYPNPVSNFATIDYQLHTDQYKSKIIVHNILGNALKEYELLASETRIKLIVDDLTAGIYFYTLYIDGEGVMTRKLIIKK
jgi:hypothetical protein